MSKKNSVGRPKKKGTEKKKLMSAYVTDSEKRIIKKKYGSLTKAVYSEVLAVCE